MKVYAWVKFLRHPKPELGGAHRGDISYFYPIDAHQGTGTHEGFMPFVVDLTIPCGDNFSYTETHKNWSCSKCEWNDPDVCDIQKYSRGLWSTGGVLEPKPKLLIKRRFKIDIDALLSQESIALIEKQDKTEEEKALVESQSNNNPILKSVIIEKVL